MNIVLVTPFDLAATGGVSTAVRMLCAEFSGKGHHISVLLAGQTNRIVKLDSQMGIPCVGIYLRVPFIERARLRGIFTFFFFLPITIGRLRRFVQENKIDAVAIQYPMPWMFYFGALRKLGLKKLVVTLQGNDVHDLPEYHWIDRLLVKWLLKNADCVVAVSKSLHDKVRQIFAGIEIGTDIVPNGAPIGSTEERVDSRSETVPKPYILTVGQIIHRKGMDLLIRALKRARDQGQVLNLVIVGEGPEQASLATEARELGVSDQVFFAGNQSHNETLAFFRQCSFFALASRAEGLPLVIVEAMANGKAVVATRIDGVPEIVLDGVTGLLVEPENPQLLAEALIKLHVDVDLRERLARQGHERAVAQYSWERIAGRYLTLFERQPT